MPTSAEFDQPVVPRPGASIVLLRDGTTADAPEVLLLRRTDKAAFMPGAWVFPGGAVDPADGEGIAGHRTCAARELSEEAGIAVAADEGLVLFSRWITPNTFPRRFDARFFLAQAPPESEARIDLGEIVDARWFTPHDALAAADADGILIALPTRVQLTQLVDFRTAEEAMDAYRNTVVEAIEPEVVGEGSEARFVVPARFL